MMFGNDDLLKGQCDEYLALVVHAAVLFRSGLGLALQDRPDEFHGRLNEMKAVERQALAQRRALLASLARRGPLRRPHPLDAGTLEQVGMAVRRMSAILRKYAVEQPVPALDGNALLMTLAERSKQTVDLMAAALRAHLARAADAPVLADAVRQEAEKTRDAGERYTGMLYRLELRLSHKNQLRDFAEGIEAIAETAASASDRAVAPRRGAVVSFGGWALRRGAAGWLVLSALAITASAVLTLTAR